ncbi:MAG: hypothetical protein HY331_06110 [Chloroflexi bacterium]|nr:hypothetical protein [Chloroflexota bacterium]
MRTLARIVGTLMVFDGAFDFAFPDAAIDFWTKGPGARTKGWLPQVAREYRCLSHGTRRSISAWEFLTGLLLTAVAARPAVAEAPGIRTERRAA